MKTPSAWFRLVKSRSTHIDDGIPETPRYLIYNPVACFQTGVLEGLGLRKASIRVASHFLLSSVVLEVESET